MTGGALNLSLLSRGIGEVQKNGHEKVEVFLEPEDYYNFSQSLPSKQFYLPPLPSHLGPSFHLNGSPSSDRTPRDSKGEYKVPKTFTTRKGALLLFSEDLAQRNMEKAAAKRRAVSQAQTNNSLTPASSMDTVVALKTVEDLTSSILQYGSFSHQDHQTDDKMYLKFVHNSRQGELNKRQIRPGYSAKRYLSTWTRTWDNTVFGNVIKKGYITERSLYQYNLVNPNLRRRMFYEDLSHMPQPYRLMRNMLMLPGSLSGYTFYRAPTQFPEEDFVEEDVETIQKPARLHNIRVIKTRGGQQEEVAYSDLDHQSQKDVITDLLVKSAVHYALKKQEEIYAENVIASVDRQQEGAVGMPGVMMDKGPQPAGTGVAEGHEFDMRDAVESLLDSHHGRYAIGADLPEIDTKSSSDITGSFKGGAVPHTGKKHTTARASADSTPREEKEYMAGVPVVGFKDSGSLAGSESSSVPHLPPIGRSVLSPIRDVSRETTSHNLSLPPITGKDTPSGTDPPTLHVQPATPQHSSLTNTSITKTGRISTEPTRGLVSREEALMEEEDEGEADPDNEASLKKDTTRSSLQSDKHRGKDTRHSIDSGMHGAGSNATSGTNKLRPQWKSSQKSLHKGQSGYDSDMEEEPDILSQAASDLPLLHISAIHSTHDTPSSSKPPSLHVSPHPPSSQHSPAPSSIGSATWDREGHFPKRHRKGHSKPSSQADSHKGSMIMAPDGEIISLGGSVVRSQDVGNMNDVVGRPPPLDAGSESGQEEDPDEWRANNKFASSHRSESLNKVQRRDSQSRKSSVTEKDIMDTLTEHAQRIAESVLSQPASGFDLQRDVQEAIRVMQDAIAEIMKNRRASSAAPSAAEYRNLIKKSLATAAAKAAGLDPETLSSEAEISDELLEALANQKLTPDQIEVVSDSDGRTRIQSRVSLNGSSHVEEGHMFIAPGGEGKPQISIPAERTSLIDDMEFDRISYQGAETESVKGKARSRGGSKPGSIAGGSKAGSIAGGTMADLTEMEGFQAALEGKVEGQDDSPEADDFSKAVAEAAGKDPSPPESVRKSASGKTTPSMVDPGIPAEEAVPVLPAGSPDKRPDDAQSVKSGKTGVSQKSGASKDSKVKGKTTPKEKEEPFVVGKPKTKKKVEPLPPIKKEEKKPPKKGKKGKKGKKKEEDASSPEELAPPKEETPKEPEPAPEPPKIVTPRMSKSPAYSEPKPSSPEYRTEDESDYEIIREASSPEMDLPQTRLNIPSPPLEEEDENPSDGEEDEGDNLKAISNREARAAKRAAAATKRREEVERRRREKEEQQKKDKEEVERQVAMQREMEEDRRRREEDRRLRKEQQRAQELNEQTEAEDRERRAKVEAERERKQKEDYQRKLEQMRRKQHEEEMRKADEARERAKEDEERRKEEEEKMAKMAVAEREAYEEQKRLEEEERQKKELEDKIKRAEEARKAMAEAQRLAEEMARKQAELEARLKFNRTLQDESSGMSHSQGINRAFVFSYFELLQWLGLDIPEFELAKLADY